VFAWILRTALCLGLAFAGPGTEAASEEAEGRIPFKVYGLADGLPSAAIHAMAQDRDGFLWLGTESGLYRFDGAGTTRWSLRDGLPSNWVTALAPAQDGGLWVGTVQGLVRLRDNRIAPVTLEGQPLSALIVALSLDSAGRLWGASGSGPFHQTGALECAPVPGCPRRHTPALWPGAHSGSVWLVQGPELFEYRKDGRVQIWNSAQGLGRETLGAVAEDGEGRVWVAANRSLHVLEPGGPRFQDRSTWMKNSLPPAPFPFLDPDGAVWMPHTRGILKLGKEGPEFLDPSKGLPLRWVKGGLFDREGSLWLMGASLVRRLGNGHIRVFQESEGLPSSLVWCVSRAPSGDLLAGTDDGLVRLGPEGFREVPGTKGIVAFSVLEEGQNLWIAATESGLLQLDRLGSRPRQIPLPEAGSACFLIEKDRQGRIWTSPSTRGAVCLHPRLPQLDLQPGDFGLPAITVITLAEAPDGTLWAATLQGLFALRDGVWRRFDTSSGLRAPDLQGAYPAADGTLWIWYNEPMGLTHVQPEAQGLKLLGHLDQTGGCPTDLIYGVRDDAQGRIWMTSDQGVLVLQHGVVRRFGLGQGLPGEDCAANSLCLDRDGALWAGLATGLVRIDPAATKDPIPAPAVQILQVAWGEQSHRMPGPAPGIVSHRQGTFEFRFASPSYLDEKALRYQVRLLGLEDEWRESDVRLARYPALPGGHYRFEVRAAYPGGAFGQAAHFEFQVRSPFWRTWWALGLSGALFGLLAYLAFRLRLRHLSRAKLQLEQLVTERTQELKASNEALGGLNDQNLQLIEELASTLKEVKTLQGLIPICSYCKSIRNDEGYWGQIEHYIQAHSKATFSHGICPECEKKVREEWIRQGMLPDPAKAKKPE